MMSRKKRKLYLTGALIVVFLLYLLIPKLFPSLQLPEGDEEQESAEFFDQQAAEDQSAAPSTETRPRKLELPAPLTDRKERLLKREGYIVSYNKDLLIPNWVAWHLTAAHSGGDYKREGMVFKEDMEVARPRATDNDYYNSRYDRGHMCPSGDNQWSSKAQDQSFLFTNICPQNHGLNKGDWNDLEIQCRFWARRYGDIYIVTGPVFYDGVQKTIGRNKVAVPDAFFKVILADGKKTRGIGFVMPNKGKHNNMTHYVRSIDEVEELTGIDFFPMLEDKLEAMVENQDRETLIEDWKVYKIKHYDRE